MCPFDTKATNYFRIYTQDMGIFFSSKIAYRFFLLYSIRRCDRENLTSNAADYMQLMNSLQISNRKKWNQNVWQIKASLKLQVCHLLFSGFWASLNCSELSCF